jgi:hypothetical protein
MYGGLGVHSGWAGLVWLQCNQNIAFRKLLVSSQELSWFLVWFFLVQRRLKEIPASSAHWGKSKTELGTEQNS